MKTWSFYKTEDGSFTGVHFSSTNESYLPDNTQPGCSAIEGIYDHLSQRIDVTVLHEISKLDSSKEAERIANLRTALVVDYMPTQPSDDHEWNADTKRWQVKPDIVAKQQRNDQALSELQALDAKENRAVSDVIADPEDKQAKARLTDIRAKKEALRALRKSLA